MPETEIIHKLHGDEGGAEGKIEDIAGVLILDRVDCMKLAKFLKHTGEITGI